ncbi:dynein regulatory complex protein 8 [Neoarius graeffei]|uniref:dynein regulatory complex protein 8 n=1 Tax=Neoarius graeffei TaxID=443677 RepID=UPI00298C0CD5|nr:dynein regulatory complex protein 8 [Neoarius graeffei]
MDVEGVEEGTQHTALWRVSAECESGGEMWAYSNRLRTVGQEILHPVTDGLKVLMYKVFGRINIQFVCTEAVVSALHKRIKSAFDVFDHESNQTVDVREIGTIVRSLGCFPTEAELHDIINEIEEEEANGFIHFEKFLPVMTEILMENKFPPISEDLILQAFEVLDQQKKGYIEPEELTKYLTQEGEPFSQEEMDEMLSAAVDPEKQLVFYKDFVAMLTLNDSQ